jgi:hypothetical protein
VFAFSDKTPTRKAIYQIAEQIELISEKNNIGFQSTREIFQYSKTLKSFDTILQDCIQTHQFKFEKLKHQLELIKNTDSISYLLKKQNILIKGIKDQENAFRFCNYLKNQADDLQMQMLMVNKQMVLNTYLTRQPYLLETIHAFDAKTLVTHLTH